MIQNETKASIKQRPTVKMIFYTSAVLYLLKPAEAKKHHQVDGILVLRVLIDRPT
jgi:hypothetical protein